MSWSTQQQRQDARAAVNVLDGAAASPRRRASIGDRCAACTPQRVVLALGALFTLLLVVTAAYQYQMSADVDELAAAWRSNAVAAAADAAARRTDARIAVLQASFLLASPAMQCFGDMQLSEAFVHAGGMHSPAAAPSSNQSHEHGKRRSAAAAFSASMRGVLCFDERRGDVRWAFVETQPRQGLLDTFESQNAWSHLSCLTVYGPRAAPYQTPITASMPAVYWALPPPFASAPGVTMQQWSLERNADDLVTVVGAANASAPAPLTVLAAIRRAPELYFVVIGAPLTAALVPGAPRNATALGGELLA
jgi:hypothetical protein